MGVRFHHAFPITDIEATRSFYGSLLGCPVGRESERWIDFDFFGHQITGHVLPDAVKRVGEAPVDGDQVPIPHFGAVLAWDDWHVLAARLKEADARFLIEPRVRFRGRVGEQATFFVLDPSGNALEFKAFQDPERVFRS